MELEQIDLNLLVLFNQLLVERRVSKVADNLGLTQPAVSNALARLRKLLGDELFLRTPAGMVPTPFADQLAEPVTYALGMIHSALNQRNTFTPGDSTRSFTVGMTDIGEIYFLPALMDRLRQAAPGVSLSTVRNTAVNLKDEMEAGKVDLAIGLLPQLKGGFFQRRLFRQRYVCLFRQGHRLGKKTMSLADFSAAEHLVVVSSGTGHGKVDEVLKRSGIERKVRLTVPHFVSVGHILQSTDLVATVPERLAQRLVEPFGLSCVTHPAKLPEVAINVFWHAKFHKAPANQWLRSLVFDMFADGGPADNPVVPPTTD
ncbi:LysR family transcriptional regulator [Aquabacterium sp.]|uniref:LysR family transcriptional regulator n=1 Tax=Aquabacterium sp. TaxID=1872578 RepID=UPI002C2C3B4B|nr:LysR family transcriptional regulator [Aquabacterium sp.]HSW06235.1 LysR family transcriptional regulator [Aquabacterium sp.]